MFTKLRNVVIAVNNIEEAAKLYSDTFGLEVVRVIDQPNIGVKSAYLAIGDITIEFIEPFGPKQEPVKKFLENRGEGIYMLEIDVEDRDAAIQSLTEKGVRLLGADPESQAQSNQVFIHPKSAKGVLIQLMRKRT